MNWINAFISGVKSFVELHPFIVLFLAGLYIALVGQLPSPTKDSPLLYREVFAALNFVSLQFKRMFPKVESSPNFQDAVNLQQKLAGQLPTPVIVPPVVEDTTPNPPKP